MKEIVEIAFISIYAGLLAEGGTDENIITVRDIVG
jgi:hypothetical protein